MRNFVQATDLLSACCDRGLLDHRAANAGGKVAMRFKLTETEMLMLDGLAEMLMRQDGTWPPELDVPDSEAPYAESPDPSKAFMVLRSKFLDKGTFFTTNGRYRTDWYECLLVTDDMREAQRACGFQIREESTCTP